MHIPPDWGIFFALIASFLVFWLIFDWLFFRPFLNLLAERERRLKDLNERTEQLIKEKKAADEQRERELALLRSEALSKREADRRHAEAEAARHIEEVRSEAKASFERVRSDIEQQLAAAEHELEALGHSLAVELAQRVMGRPLNGNSNSGDNG